MAGMFAANLVWRAFVDLFTSGLPTVDVQPVTEKDLDGDGLILTPPSIRVFYAGDSAEAMGDAQRQNYDRSVRLIAVCGDTYAGDSIQQAYASLALADQAAALAVGARILLSTGEVSEPARFISIEGVPAKGVGMAYAVAFEVPGLAQFPAPNAYPDLSNQEDFNG